MALEQRGDELWAEFDDPDDAPCRLRPRPGSADRCRDRQVVPGSARRIKRQVVLTTGSHNQQIYWYATGHGRTLGQLPAIWLVDERRWIPRRAAVMHPPGQAAFSETGAWNGICVACHTTLGRPAFDTPFGSQPIATQTGGYDGGGVRRRVRSVSWTGRRTRPPQREPSAPLRLHLTKSADASIVDPARLDPRRSAQVCGQCHSFWEFEDPAAERAANARGLPYRPGDDLRQTRFIVQPTVDAGSAIMQRFLQDDPGFIRDMFWSDGMVRATGREYNALIESPCYKNATDDRHTLTCASCHTMHQTADDRRAVAEWADDQLKPSATRQRRTRRVCTCQRGCSPRTRIIALTPAGSVCMNCHMPYTTYGLLKTVRSHQIGNPSVKATLDTGRPNACNLCHLDKTLAWTAEYLEQWYRIPKPRVGCRPAVGGGVGADASQRRRGSARHRGAEPGLGAGAAGVRHRLDGAISRADAAGRVRRRAPHRDAIARDAAAVQARSAAAQQNASCCSTPTARLTPRPSIVWSARATTGRVAYRE